MTIEILKVKEADEKEKIVKEVLHDLPEWFGLPESTQAYINDSRHLTLFAATDGKQNVGFITTIETSAETIEIHAMGVKRIFHRQGIGRQLVEAAERDMANHYKIIQVKTVAEGHYDEYDQTILFYKQMGFIPLEVFPTLWDEWNPCLVMVKAIQPLD